MSITIETIIRDDSGREITINKTYDGKLSMPNLESVESFMYQAKQDIGSLGETGLLLLNLGCTY